MITSAVTDTDSDDNAIYTRVLGQVVILIGKIKLEMSILLFVFDKQTLTRKFVADKTVILYCVLHCFFSSQNQFSLRRPFEV